MEHYAIFLMTASSCALLSGCEGLLDTYPEYQYTVDTFLKTETHADAGLTSCYTSLRREGIYGGGAWATPLWEETATPNATDYNSASGFFRIAEGIHDGSNSGIINNQIGRASCTE